MDFIQQRSKSKEVDDQIHVIWCNLLIYCLPRCGSSDNVLRFCFDPDLCRPLFPLEVKFFNEQRAGNGKLIWNI